MRNLLFLILLLAGCAKLPSPFHANDVSSNFGQVDFHLTDPQGKARTLADFRGKVVVVFFGYTHSPDVCATTLVDLAEMQKLLGKDADRVQVLFITIDPERDKAELLAQYVPAFNPSFVGLYGDAEATAQAARTFYIAYQKQPTSSGYNMNHSTGIYLLDPKGRVRLNAQQTQHIDWLVEDVHLLLSGV